MVQGGGGGGVLTQGRRHFSSGGSTWKTGVICRTSVPGQGSHASVAEGRRPDLCDLLARGLEVAVGRQVSVRITSSASSEAGAGPRGPTSAGRSIRTWVANKDTGCI